MNRIKHGNVISDNWEAEKLNKKQKTYAANDASAALDIFLALVYSTKKRLQLPLNYKEGYLSPGTILSCVQSESVDILKTQRDRVFKQSKEDMNLVYALLREADPGFDISAYVSKSKKTKESTLNLA